MELAEKTDYQTYLHLQEIEGQNVNYQNVELVFAKNIKITE